ncbi:hypothetical protein GCM10010172_72670 [Paractinoplanes ferrugineus]|uniref:Uncharacterized protein n=1 Tax=Paractinoplanes ferrugineus TaxID=113564 RepID=A0A919J271_9ACTN|nr:hypothetical protein Afe05nite_34180 [Actinoplanes ferrugineus]
MTLTCGLPSGLTVLRWTNGPEVTRACRESGSRMGTRYRLPGVSSAPALWRVILATDSPDRRSPAVPLCRALRTRLAAHPDIGLKDLRDRWPPELMDGYVNAPVVGWFRDG